MNRMLLVVLVAVLAVTSSQNFPGLPGLGSLPDVSAPNTAVSALLSKVIELVSTLLHIIVTLLATILGAIFKPNHTFVDVPNVGPIKGLVRKFETDPSRVYYQYKGIPYAESPVRFTVATAKQPWSDTHDGTVEGKVCPQFLGAALFTGEISEDCLVLTVTTPVNPNSNTGNVPVVVFLHGGFYAILGSSHTDWYDPQLLVQEGIIVVQVQYRLSAFGFITDGDIIPKNIGLKDMRLALKWVRNNIATFGGDPTKVTLHGESAGAMAASALYQSSRTTYLCNRVFMQSGNIISPFAINKDPANGFKKVLMGTRCADTVDLPVQEQVNCLKNLPMVELNVVAGGLLVIDDIAAAGLIDGGTAALVMEDASDLDAIIIEKPLDQLMAGGLPSDKSILMTITSEEMFTFELLLYVLRGKPNAGLVPAGMAAFDPNAVGKKIKEEYAGGELEWDIGYQSVITDYASDIIFNIPARYYVQQATPVVDSNNGVYFMQFSYSSPIGIFNDGSDKVGHIDDLFYTWKLQAVTVESLRKNLFSAENIRKRNQYNRMVANFVAHGNPTPGPDELLDNVIWPKVADPNSITYLNFDHELEVMQNPKDQHYQFWMDRYTQDGNPTITL